MDPNLMSQMFSNPDMMNSMQEMMKNPEIMKSAMDMMKNPEIMNMFGGLENSGSQVCQEDCDDCEQCEENTFNTDDVVTLQNLKSEVYNGKQGVVREFLTDRERYSIYIEELDKTISVKEENIRADDSSNNDVTVEIENVD